MGNKPLLIYQSDNPNCLKILKNLRQELDEDFEEVAIEEGSVIEIQRFENKKVYLLGVFKDETFFDLLLLKTKKLILIQQGSRYGIGYEFHKPTIH